MTPEIFIVSTNTIERDDMVLILGDKTSRKLSLAPPAAIWDQSTTPPKAKLPVNFALRSEFAQTNEWEKTKKGTSLANKLAAELPPDLLHHRRDEMASWLPLLHRFHEVTRASFESEELPNPKDVGDTTPDTLLTWRRYPALVMQERSWDFQPPDVIRPLAKTTISTIAIMARRMGMRWKDFRPEEGILRAEGHSHIITSTVVRSLGLVLQYSYTGKSKRLARQSPWRAAVAGSIYKEEEEIYISTPAADRFGAGIIRGSRSLGVPDITVGTQQEIVNALRILDYTEICSTALKNILRRDPEFQFPVADIAAMTSHMICQARSPLVQIPAPGDNTRGITAGSLGRRAFTNELESYILRKEGGIPPRQGTDWSQKKVGEQTCWVLRRLKHLRKTYPHEFDSDRDVDSSWAVRRPVKYLEDLNQVFDLAKNFFLDPRYHNILHYTDILQAHLVVAVFAHDREIPLNSSAEVEITRLITAHPGQVVKSYFAALPRLINYVQWSLPDSVNRPNERLIVDCWTTMMLRAICWGASHFLVPGERVPIAYFGSQLPVYIG